jgi:hypothetical protein
LVALLNSARIVLSAQTVQAILDLINEPIDRPHNQLKNPVNNGQQDYPKQ